MAIERLFQRLLVNQSEADFDFLPAEEQAVITAAIEFLEENGTGQVLHLPPIQKTNPNDALSGAGK